MKSMKNYDLEDLVKKEWNTYYYNRKKYYNSKYDLEYIIKKYEKVKVEPESARIARVRDEKIDQILS